MENIEPTSIKPSYKLDDVDYLKIKAMQELTEAIQNSNRIAEAKR